MRQMPRVDIRFDTFALQGGLDMETPQLSLKPGTARAALNFECRISGGYSRIAGYERFDGRPSPSTAVPLALQVASAAGLLAGDAVSGQTSGATGVVAAVDGLVVVLTKLAGVFVAGEQMVKAGAALTTIATVGVSITDRRTLATYALAAANVLRADIQPLPGSGSVLGVWFFSGVVYAARNNASGSGAAIFKQGAAGWIGVQLPYEVGFTSGSAAPAIGSTITARSVSAVVRKVVVESGDFLSGTAAGRFIVDTPTGGSFTAGAIGSGGAATLSVMPGRSIVQAAVSLLPGGRFETVTGNAGNGIALYGCDGVNRAFEFDGTTLVPINSGQTVDAPTHVAVHRRRLFLSFGASAQYSGVAAPYQWTALSGAAEFAVSQPITDFLVMPGSATSPALAVLSATAVSILYGTGTSDWNLVEFNGALGSQAYSAQRLEDAYVYDANGLFSLTAVQNFGNFDAASLTARLRSFVQARRTMVTESIVNKERSQYRVFYSDGYGLYVTVINGQFAGAMPVQFPNPVTCACGGANVNGGEVSYFGSTNGVVYRMDLGTSFDGAPINYSFDLVFAFEGNARLKKRYRKAVLEIQGEGYAEFTGGWTLAYGSGDAPQGMDAVTTRVSGLSTMHTAVSDVFWDQFVWDEFTWDGQSTAPSSMSVEGSAENLALSVTGSSALWPAFTVNAATLHYTPRRILR